MLTRRHTPALLALACMIVLMAAAQLLFKQAGLHAGARPELPGGLLFNPWLWAGLAVSAVGMLCWLLALRVLPLAAAYPWTALIYVLTPLASALCFGDALSSHYAGGMLLVVTGVFLAAGGVRAR